MLLILISETSFIFNSCNCEHELWHTCINSKKLLICMFLEEKDEISSTGYHKDINNLNEKAYSSHSLSSNEDSCPNQAVESPEQREEIKKELDEGQEEMNLKIEPQSPERESTMDIQSLGLENKLGIPEEAPLRVEISSNGITTCISHFSLCS